MQSVPPFVVPSVASTAAFVAIVFGLCVAWVYALRRAWPEKPRQVTWMGAAVLAAVLASTAALAETGVLSSSIGSVRAGLYFIACNASAVALVLSPVGRRFARVIPPAWLVGIHAFRLPLELVLHSWYEQGSLPVQMTYEGDNWDIATGIIAVALGLGFPSLGPRARYWSGLAFTAVGLVLLVRVMKIAVTSTPWPLRSYMNDPPVLLGFHAPYTWIVPLCVAGALFAHGVMLRWLWHERRR